MRRDKSGEAINMAILTMVIFWVYILIELIRRTIN